jgi:hypothetical protein
VVESQYFACELRATEFFSLTIDCSTFYEAKGNIFWRILRNTAGHYWNIITLMILSYVHNDATFLVTFPGFGYRSEACCSNLGRGSVLVISFSPQMYGRTLISSHDYVSHFSYHYLRLRSGVGETALEGNRDTVLLLLLLYCRRCRAAGTGKSSLCKNGSETHLAPQDTTLKMNLINIYICLSALNKTVIQKLTVP